MPPYKDLMASAGCLMTPTSRYYVCAGLLFFVGGCGPSYPAKPLPPLVEIDPTPRKIEPLNPPEPNRKESTSFSTLRLVSATPPVKSIVDTPIEINRLYLVESQKYSSGWSTIRVSTFSGQGKIEVASDQ